MSRNVPNHSPLRPGATLDPVALARREAKKALPKRFYKEAGVAERDGAFGLVLDGRPALTPRRRPLALPARAAAELLAAEWAAQREMIDPVTMPITRIVNVALDGVAFAAEAVRAEVVNYAASDLLCYRAAEPEALAEAQRKAWDPVLAWADQALGITLRLAAGVTFIAQPDSSIAAAAAAVAAVPAPVPLASLHVMTALTGSALLALAVAHGRLAESEAWTIAHVDEDFQMQAWGADAEAIERRRLRAADMHAAARLFDLIRGA